MGFSDSSVVVIAGVVDSAEGVAVASDDVANVELAAVVAAVVVETAGACVVVDSSATVGEEDSDVVDVVAVSAAVVLLSATGTSATASFGKITVDDL